MPAATINFVFFESYPSISALKYKYFERWKYCKINMPKRAWGLSGLHPGYGPE
jgi:hypothetical protein